MTLRTTPGRIASRIAHPKTTVRWRLTLLYGGLFLASGAALLAFTYTLADKTTINRTAPVQAIVQHAVAKPPGLPTGSGKSSGTPLTPGNVRRSTTSSPGARQNFLRSEFRRRPRTLKALQEFKEFFSNGPGRKAILFVGTQQRVADLHQLIVESSIALAVMALISAALGWLVAGRVLRPLRTMTSTTQQISETSLDRRLAMDGPRDELRQLADTIDGLLERSGGRVRCAAAVRRQRLARASHAADRGTGDARDDHQRPAAQPSTRSARRARRSSTSLSSKSS